MRTRASPTKFWVHGRVTDESPLLGEATSTPKKGTDGTAEKKSVGADYWAYVAQSRKGRGKVYVTMMAISAKTGTLAAFCFTIALSFKEGST